MSIMQCLVSELRAKISVNGVIPRGAILRASELMGISGPALRGIVSGRVKPVKAQTKRAIELFNRRYVGQLGAKKTGPKKKVSRVKAGKLQKL